MGCSWTGKWGSCSLQHWAAPLYIICNFWLCTTKSNNGVVMCSCWTLLVWQPDPFSTPFKRMLSWATCSANHYLWHFSHLFTTSVTCSQAPCSPGVSCVDTGTSQRCGPCPTGSEGNGVICISSAKVGAWTQNVKSQHRHGPGKICSAIVQSQPLLLDTFDCGSWIPELSLMKYEFC